MNNIYIDEDMLLPDKDLDSVSGGVKVEYAVIIATVQYWYENRYYGVATDDSSGVQYFIHQRLFDKSTPHYHLSSGEKVELKIVNDKAVSLSRLC